MGNSHHLAQNSAGPLGNVEDDFEDMITRTLPMKTMVPTKPPVGH